LDFSSLVVFNLYILLGKAKTSCVLFITISTSLHCDYFTNLHNYTHIKQLKAQQVTKSPAVDEIADHTTLEILTG